MLKSHLPNIALFASILLGGLSVWIGRVDRPDDLLGAAAPRSGAPAPNFTLVDMGGYTHTLEDYRGQAVILNFWAVWCIPCRAEMPDLQAVYDDYREQGLVVLAVNRDDSPTAITEFVAEHNLSFPILPDTSLEASRTYNVQAYPSTYFIDRGGRIRHTTFTGPMSKSFIESQVLELLD